MENPQGELISDYYEYNDSIPNEVTPTLGPETPEAIAHRGIHWVGDLMLDANIQVVSPTGNLLLQCVEGGIKFTCTINVETGEAFVAADSDRIPKAWARSWRPRCSASGRRWWAAAPRAMRRTCR